jgi:hypothetical protein
VLIPSEEEPPKTASAAPAYLSNSTSLITHPKEKTLLSPSGSPRSPRRDISSPRLPGSGDLCLRDVPPGATGPSSPPRSPRSMLEIATRPEARYPRRTAEAAQNLQESVEEFTEIFHSWSQRIEEQLKELRQSFGSLNGSDFDMPKPPPLARAHLSLQRSPSTNSAKTPDAGSSYTSHAGRTTGASLGSSLPNTEEL